MSVGVRVDFTNVHRKIDVSMPKPLYLSPVKNIHTWHTYLKIHPTLRQLVSHFGGEAKVYLADKLIYDYNLCGPEPRSAGDTHGAIETDGKVVYFGGWAEAPANRDPITQTHDRSGKFSHLHMIDENGDVQLLWIKRYDENINTSEWYAEVTDLLWDPYRKLVWVARGDIVMDDHPSLRDDGLYYWDPDTQELKPFRVNSGGGEYLRMYKMDFVGDILVLNNERGNTIYMYDFREDTWTDVTNAVDLFDNNVSIPSGRGGFVKRAFGSRLFVWQSGILLIFRSRTSSPPFRALPFFTDYSQGALYHRVGGRAQTLRVGKGILVVANIEESDSVTMEGSDHENAVLVYIDGSSPKIVATLPYTSGLETDGKYVYIATGLYNHETEGIVFNTQSGSIYAIPVSDIIKAPLESVRLLIYEGSYTTSAGLNGYIGGIPTRGFSKKILKIYTDTACTLTVLHYILGSFFVETEDISLNSGWNSIDLSQYSDILAFKLSSNATIKAYMVLDL